MNKVTIIGNLVRALELKNYKDAEQKGSWVKITLEINGCKNKEKEAIFINIVAFGKQVEILSKYLVQIRSILVERKLNNLSWIDSKDEKRYSTNIILEEFQFLDNKKEIV